MYDTSVKDQIKALELVHSDLRAAIARDITDAPIVSDPQSLAMKHIARAIKLLRASIENDPRPDFPVLSFVSGDNGFYIGQTSDGEYRIVLPHTLRQSESIVVRHVNGRKIISLQYGDSFYNPPSQAFAFTPAK